jgi:hypothetical protein
VGRQKNIIALRGYCRKRSEERRSLGDNAFFSPAAVNPKRLRALSFRLARLYDVGRCFRLPGAPRLLQRHLARLFVFLRLNFLCTI